MTLDEIVDNVGFFHRVEWDEVGAERRAVLASLVPRSVEVWEAIAGAPAADTDELIRAACVSTRSDDDARACATHVDAAACSHRARFDRRHRLRHLSQVGADLADVAQRPDRQLLHYFDEFCFQQLQLSDRHHSVLAAQCRDAVVL